MLIDRICRYSTGTLTTSLLERQRRYEASQNRLIDDALEGLEEVVKTVSTQMNEDTDKGKGKGKEWEKSRSNGNGPIWLNCSVGEMEAAEDSTGIKDSADQVGNFA